jgi:hypothetical protein
LQKKLTCRYRRTQLPQRSFSSFPHRARSWPHQRRVCYKAEHTAAGTNLRFVLTNRAGRAEQVFAFYNDRGECENRIEEFKNSFRADRLTATAFWPTPSASSSTPPPTTWSTSFACSCRCPGAPPRSKSWTLNSSKSAPASAVPPAASASTWPAVGPTRIYFAPPRSPSIAAYTTSPPRTPSDRFLRSRVQNPLPQAVTPNCPSKPDGLTDSALHQAPISTPRKPISAVVNKQASAHS